MQKLSRGLVALILAGASVSSLYAADAPATAPAATQPAKLPLALINGQAVDREEFVNQLMYINGLKHFNLVLGLTVVRQAARAGGFTLAQEEASARQLRQNVLNQLGAQAVPEKDRESVLQQLLARQNVTMLEWEQTLLRNACIRFLSQDKAPVTPAQVEEAFAKEYGEKVVVRDIVVRSVEDAAEIRRLITQEHKDVAEIARQRSVDQLSAPNGGLVAPIAKADTQITPALKDQAFKLQPGELSPGIFSNQLIHLLWLEKRIPAQTDVKFETVREEITRKLKEFAENQWGAQELQRLMLSAKIHFEDPILGNQYITAFNQLRQQQAAATQAAAKTATQPATVAPSR